MTGVIDQTRTRGFTGVYDADEHRRMVRQFYADHYRPTWPFKRVLTDEEVLEIRQQYAAGAVRQQDLADAYGVSQKTISNLVHGSTYADVGGDEHEMG